MKRYMVARFQRSDVNNLEADDNMVDELNVLASFGWRVVSDINQAHYYKFLLEREIPDQQQGMEYITIFHPRSDLAHCLNYHGEYGWELKHISEAGNDSFFMIFMRKIPETPLPEEEMLASSDPDPLDDPRPL